MQKARLQFLISLIALFVFGALLTRQAGVLLLVLPLLVYLAAGVMLAPAQVQIVAQRSLLITSERGLVQSEAGPGSGPLSSGPLNSGPRLVAPGSLVTVTVQVDNQGPPLAEVLIADRLWEHGTSLGSGTRSAWEYSFSPRRGPYLFEPLKVTAGDPFGLFSTSLELPAPTDGDLKGELLVLPRSLPLKRVPVRPFLLRGFAGPIAAHQAGSGTDFFDVRQYQPGDSLRRLNWRVSSRHTRELFSNQYEGERYADIGLILDARATRNLSAGPMDLFEASVLATASLGEAFLRDGHRLSLLVYGMGMMRLRPGSGRGHIKSVLRLLAQAYPWHNYALDDLYYLPTRLYPPRSQIVFVSPLGRDDFAPLVRFRAQGYDVLVVSPDPVDFEARYLYRLGDDRRGAGDLGLAVRLAQVERALLLRRLQRYGVGVVDWQINRPLEQALWRGLAIAQRGQHILRI